MAEERVVVAGAAGDLGGRVVRELLARGARVRAIVRTRNEKALALERQGVQLAESDFGSTSSLARACEGASCVVSVISGLRDVIVEAQTRLVDGAVEAGCPRFIPSDYALDFTRLPMGSNRNLDWRREFLERLHTRKIAATSILNGAFMELLTGKAPFLLFPLKRALYFGDVDQKLDFTAMDDIARYTAYAALDATTPRFLRIAGDVVSAKDLAATASEVTGKQFRPLRGGGLRRLQGLIWLTRKLAGGENEVVPPWQGMQYTRDMFDGRGKLEPLDNARYPVRFMSIKELLAQRRA